MERCVGCGTVEEVGLVNTEPSCFDCFVEHHDYLFRLPPDAVWSGEKSGEPLAPLLDEVQERERWSEKFKVGERPEVYCLHQSLSAEAGGSIRRT